MVVKGRGMRLGMIAALMVAGAADAVHPAPAVALQATDADTEIAALDSDMARAFAIDYATQKDAKRDRFLSIRARAKAAAQRFAAYPALAMRLHEIQGVAAFHAAQNNDPEWNDMEGEKAEIVWLNETVTLLAPSLAATGGAVGPHSEFRGAAGQLVTLGRRYEDPRLRRWSETRVLANRYRVKALPGDDFESHLLVEALYDHGELTGDQVLIAEGDRIAATITEADLRDAVRAMRAAVAAGDLPYATRD